MRAANVARLTVLILLLVATFADAAMPESGPTVVAGNNGNNKDKQKDKDSKDDKGRGNDDKEDSTGVTVDAGYAVEVTCEPGADDSVCTFAPVTPDGQKKVSHLLVPEAILCAEVLQTDARYVDPDPKMQQTGYMSRGSSPTVVLHLSGTVDVAGTGRYWVKAAGTIHPANGPALACVAAASAGESTPAAPTTGTVVIEARGCADVDPELDAIDWYGDCQLDASAHEYQLAQVTEMTNPLHATMSSEDGLATFADLAPGVYTLEDAGDPWCHAESDRVNGNGNVIVEAGATTTVWLFYCQ